MIPHKIFWYRCVFVSGWPSSVWEAIDSYRGCPKLSFRGEMSWDVDIGIEVLTGGDDNPERDTWHSTDAGQRRGKTERVENTLKFEDM